MATLFYFSRHRNSSIVILSSFSAISIFNNQFGILKNLSTFAAVFKMEIMKLRRLTSKMILTAAAVLSVLTANAEGYQINSQSVRQWGMAHTGTALKLGAESMLFNPAGLSYMNSKFDISFGTIAISSKVKFEQGDYNHQTDNPLSTPVFGHIGYKPCENLAFGVNLTNPAGNSLVWGDNWAGATMIQNVSLKAFSIQPTVSYKIADVVSIGAGLMIDFGSFAQRRGLVAANAFNGLGTLAGQLSSMMPSLGALPGAIQSFNNQIPVGIQLEGSSKVAYGFNAGILVNVSPKVTIGATYRSKMKLSVEGGKANIEYANDNAKKVVDAIKSFDTTPLKDLETAGMLPAGTTATLQGTQEQLATMGMLDGAEFSASMPIPSIFSAGITYTPTEKWTLTGEAQFTGWSAYDKLDITFKTIAGDYLQSSEKNYKNTVAVRLGAERIISDFFTVRAGIYMDTPPVQMDNYNPETPSANSYGVTAGATLNPTKFLAVDLAVGYLRGEKTTGSFDNGSFVADYTKSAIMPGLGLRFKF